MKLNCVQIPMLSGMALKLLTVVQTHGLRVVAPTADDQTPSVEACTVQTCERT
jgi:hypothetical protein